MKKIFLTVLGVVISAQSIALALETTSPIASARNWNKTCQGLDAALQGNYVGFADYSNGTSAVLSTVFTKIDDGQFLARVGSAQDTVTLESTEHEGKKTCVAKGSKMTLLLVGHNSFLVQVSGSTPDAGSSMKLNITGTSDFGVIAE